MTKVLSAREERIQSGLYIYTDYLQKLLNKLAGVHKEQVVVETGRKYFKVITVHVTDIDGKHTQRRVHSFVDRKTGDVYKPAGWAAPVLDARYNVDVGIKTLLQSMDPFGGYLYKKNPLTNR